jgi:hypothetical protein
MSVGRKIHEAECITVYFFRCHWCAKSRPYQRQVTFFTDVSGPLVLQEVGFLPQRTWHLHSVKFFTGLPGGIPNGNCLDVIGCSHGGDSEDSCLWNVTPYSVVEVNWGYREHASCRRIPHYTMSRKYGNLHRRLGATVGHKMFETSLFLHFCSEN